ncbi:hypothetical protein C4J81_05715 [Deltaproteobacteria bacterium Smac51]|nr:hypothetical protein C4J81_05715 [Deltaproteobacteria bacterium Smac51]
MADYREYLAAVISHPLTDFSLWSLLPGAAAESFLGASRLKLRFGEGRLSLWGEDGLEIKSVPSGPLEFYLFCSDPWFLRSTEAPVFRPDEELLLMAAGTDDQGPAAGLSTIVYSLQRRKEVAAARKKYQGKVFGPPPVAVLSLAASRPDEGRALEIMIGLKPRRLFWIYEIAPRPSGRMRLSGGLCHYRLAVDEKERAVFISETPQCLTRSPSAGLNLEMILDEEKEMVVPLMENLPAPGLNGVAWDNELNAYKATVRLDLGCFGLIS